MNGSEDEKIKIGFAAVRLLFLAPALRLTIGAVIRGPMLAKDLLSFSSRNRIIERFFLLARIWAAAAGVSCGWLFLISEIRTAIDPLAISRVLLKCSRISFRNGLLISDQLDYVFSVVKLSRLVSFRPKDICSPANIHTILKMVDSPPAPWRHDDENDSVSENVLSD